MESKKVLGIIAGIIVIGLIVLMVKGSSVSPGGSGEYGEFAKCLTESGAKMFGAYWCPHCKNQKAAFGDAWKNIDYIECSKPNVGGQTDECNREGITGYPTWEFSSGQRLSGELAFEQLAQASGCELVKDTETEQ